MNALEVAMSSLHKPVVHPSHQTTAVSGDLWLWRGWGPRWKLHGRRSVSTAKTPCENETISARHTILYRHFVELWLSEPGGVHDCLDVWGWCDVRRRQQVERRAMPGSQPGDSPPQFSRTHPYVLYKHTWWQRPSTNHKMQNAALLPGPS